MGQEILTPAQRQFLTLLQREPSFAKAFWLTGGTALAAFYLNHRSSEDLGLFSQQPIELLAIETFLKQHKRFLRIHSMDLEQSFNRNLFFLKLADRQVLKVEWTYFPFPSIQPPKKQGSLCIDSLLDIAVNKAFTIAQQPRARDFVDLYWIFQGQPQWSLQKLLKLARAKFDWHVDPIQLGTQLLRIRRLADYPRMLKPLRRPGLIRFFEAEARQLKSAIFR